MEHNNEDKFSIWKINSYKKRMHGHAPRFKIQYPMKNCCKNNNSGQFYCRRGWLSHVPVGAGA